MNVAPATAPRLSIANVVGGAVPSPACRRLGKRFETGESDGHVIMMGCAGMARHRTPLEDALGVMTAAVARLFGFNERRRSR